MESELHFWLKSLSFGDSLTSRLYPKLAISAKNEDHIPSKHLKIYQKNILLTPWGLLCQYANLLPDFH